MGDQPSPTNLDVIGACMLKLCSTAYKVGVLLICCGMHFVLFSLTLVQIAAVHQHGHCLHAPLLRVSLVHQLPMALDSGRRPLPRRQGRGTAAQTGSRHTSRRSMQNQPRQKWHRKVKTLSQ